MTQKSLRKVIHELLCINVLYIKKYIYKYPADVLKHTVNNEKKIILLMIPNGKVWHYLSVKELSSLLRDIMSKQVGVFIA